MASKLNLPKWSTPERKAILVELWAVYGNQCLQGHTACPNPEHYIYIQPVTEVIGKPVEVACQDRQGNLKKDSEGNQIYITLYKAKTFTISKPLTSRLYDYIIEGLIDDWKADDRITRQLEYRIESIALHSLAEPTKPLRGIFSAISKDIWKSSQPLYYIENMAISGITLQPFVKIRLASSYMHLHVNLGDTLREVSKNKRRKAIRYGKPLPASIEESIGAKIREAVRHYLDH